MSCCPPTFKMCVDQTRVLVTFNGDGSLSSVIPLEGPDQGSDISADVAIASLTECQPPVLRVAHADGPGTPDTAIGLAAQSQHWVVTDGPTGNEEDWCILLDTNGVPQWHQRA